MELKLALIQPVITWEDIDANLAALEQRIEGVAEAADAVILPELFTTGFTMRSRELAEGMDGRTVSWMNRLADHYGCVIAGSLIIRVNASYYNRFIWMEPGGRHSTYDKRHLFRMSGEDLHYDRGERNVTFEINKVRIRPQICYDLRFPVWSRNCQDYEVLIYVANWPAARRDVWISLLKARAIENQAYVIGVNRTGRDGMGIDYMGDSLAYDAKGQVIASLPPQEDGILVVDLSMKVLQDFRQKFPVWKDSDQFKILD
jgi:predicted amidohydrolase